MSIAFVDTDNIYIAIIDLLSEAKRALIARTFSGQAAIPLLEAMAERLALVTRRGKPYAAELAAADQRHDIGGVALDLICQLHELLGALPGHADAAERSAAVRATLSMGRGIITASYGQEAANAHRNRRVLPEIADVLGEMPAIRGFTALDAAELFIAGGEEVGALLSKRADALATAQAARAESGGSNLLHEARDLLQRTRTMLANEVSMRPDLPDDLVPRIFSALDERIAVATASRARQSRPAATTADDAPAADADPGDGEGIDGEGRDGSATPEPDLDGGASADE